MLLVWIPACAGTPPSCARIRQEAATHMGVRIHSCARICAHTGCPCPHTHVHACPSVPVCTHAHHMQCTHPCLPLYVHMYTRVHVRTHTLLSLNLCAHTRSCTHLSTLPCRRNMHGHPAVPTQARPHTCTHTCAHAHVPRVTSPPGQAPLQAAQHQPPKPHLPSGPRHFAGVLAAQAGC